MCMKVTLLFPHKLYAQTIMKRENNMIIQEIRTIDELLQFMNGLYEKHGSRLWYRGEENAKNI